MQRSASRPTDAAGEAPTPEVVLLVVGARGRSVAVGPVGRLLRHRSIVFVLSDFQVGEHGLDPLQRTLKLIGRRHDVIAVRIADPLEAELPNAGLLVLTDPESGERIVVDTASKAVRVQYARGVRAEREAMRRMFRQQGIDEVEVSTDQSYVSPLLAFFRRRERQGARRR